MCVCVCVCIYVYIIHVCVYSRLEQQLGTVDTAHNS